MTTNVQCNFLQTTPALVTASNAPRTDDETQYQYRKRRIEEHRQEPVHQEQEDPRIEKALNVKNVLQTIMRMNKEDLKKTLAEKKDTMEELARSQPMEVKTINNMRLSLLAIEVYERFNFVVT